MIQRAFEYERPETLSSVNPNQDLADQQLRAITGLKEDPIEFSTDVFDLLPSAVDDYFSSNDPSEPDSGGSTPPSTTPPNTVARIMEIKVVGDASLVSAGNGKAVIGIPYEFNGLNLTRAEAFISSLSVSGDISVQIRNATNAVDMLTSNIFIDQGDFTSFISTSPSVINAATRSVATGDRIAIDVDSAGSGALGLGVILTFQ